MTDVVQPVAVPAPAKAVKATTAAKAAPKAAAPKAAAPKAAAPVAATGSEAAVSARVKKEVPVLEPGDRATQSVLVAQFAEKHKVPKTEAAEILHAVTELFVENLKKGNSVQVSGLGTLKVITRNPRTVMNMKTREKVAIEGYKTVYFVPSAEVKRLPN